MIHRLLIFLCLLASLACGQVLNLPSLQDPDTAETVRERLNVPSKDELPWVSIIDFGAEAGTGKSAGVRTANTVAIQAAFDSGGNVLIPEGIFEINSALIWRKEEIVISGLDSKKSAIHQTNSAEHGIVCESDPDASWGVTRSGILKNLRIYGTGRATHTGHGIYTTQPSSPSMAALRCRDVYVRDFSTGLYLDRWDNSLFEGCEFSWNARNVYTNNQTLTVLFINCRNSSTTGYCWETGSSGKISIIGCDTGNGAGHVYNAGGFSAKNSNFETVSSGSPRGHFDNATNGSMWLDTVTILGGSSILPAIYAEGFVAVGNITITGFGTGGGKIRKHSFSTVLHVFGTVQLVGNRSTGLVVDHNGSFEMLPFGTFDSTYYNSSSTPGTGNRGLTQFLAFPNAFGGDRVVVKAKNRGDQFADADILNWTQQVTVNVSGTTQAASPNVWYRSTNAALTTITLPTTAYVDDEIRIMSTGAGGVRVAQNANQVIRTPSGVTTTGASGYMEIPQYSAATLKCTNANNGWQVVSITGTPTLN